MTTGRTRGSEGSPGGGSSTPCSLPSAGPRQGLATLASWSQQKPWGHYACWQEVWVFRVGSCAPDQCTQGEQGLLPSSPDHTRRPSRARMVTVAPGEVAGPQEGGTVCSGDRASAFPRVSLPGPIPGGHVFQEPRDCQRWFPGCRAEALNLSSHLNAGCKLPGTLHRRGGGEDPGTLCAAAQGPQLLGSRGGSHLCRAGVTHLKDRSARS